MLKGQSLSFAEHDLSEGDIHRLLVWQEQRGRLRQSVLGKQVTKAWYAEQEDQFTRTLNFLLNAAIASGQPRYVKGMQESINNIGESYRTLGQWAEIR